MIQALNIEDSYGNRTFQASFIVTFFTIFQPNSLFRVAIIYFVVVTLISSPVWNISSEKCQRLQGVKSEMKKCWSCDVLLKTNRAGDDESKYLDIFREKDSIYLIHSTMGRAKKLEFLQVIKPFMLTIYSWHTENDISCRWKRKG